MPTYAYACRTCGHSFDIVQSFSDDSLTECPECGGSLRKLFNAVGVVFKGSGFYRTDSRGSDASKTSSGSSSSSSSTESSTSGSASDGGSGTKSSSTTSSTPASSGSASTTSSS